MAKDTDPAGRPPRPRPRTVPQPDVDPELEADLGPELTFRGDTRDADLAAAHAETAEWRDRAARAQAEFENARRRLSAQHADAVKRAAGRVVEELLPVLDNLERAIDHATAEGSSSELLKGVEMVHAQILDVFAKEGVELEDPFGGPFDPERHQAVGEREDVEVPEGTVVDVYQKGYVMHGRVLRPAMVIVSTGGPARAEE